MDELFVEIPYVILYNLCGFLSSDFKKIFSFGLETQKHYLKSD